jgi:predicted nucleic acid-binding protein
VIAAGARLLIDSSVLIAYLEDDEPASERATQLLEELVSTGRNEAIISSVSVAEVMVGPTRLGAGESETRAFLLTFPNLDIRSADVLVCGEAARIRAQTGLPLADSIILATATMTSCDWLVTCDRGLATASHQLRGGPRTIVLGEPRADSTS